MQRSLTQKQLGETMVPRLWEALGAVTPTAKTGHQEGSCGVGRCLHEPKEKTIMEKVKIYSLPT